MRQRGVVLLLAFLLAATSALAAVPVASNVELSTSAGGNTSDENLTVTFDITDGDGDATENVTDFRLNGTSLAVAFFPMEGHPNDANVIKDYSTFENNGTVSTPTLVTSGGYNDRGYYDSGPTPGNMQVPHSKEVSFAVNENFTITIWIRNRVPPAGTDCVFVKDVDTDGLGGADDYQLCHDGTTSLDFDLPGLGDVSISPNPITNESWSHVAIRRNATNVSMYINGTLLDSADPGSAPAAGGSMGFLRFFRAGAPEVWQGHIDEFRIYKRALSDEQIQLLANKNTTTILSQETQSNETWQACVTPNDGTSDGDEVCSSNLTLTQSGCGTITTSTTLASNVTGNGDCFDITADDIVLDCAGFTITGNGSGTGIDATNQNNVTVNNCTVEDFDISIDFTSSTNSSLFNSQGFNATGGFGGSIELNGSSVNLHVENVTGQTIDPDQAGILVSGTNHTLKNLNGTSNSSAGISLGGTNHTLQDSNGTSNSGSGITTGGSGHTIQRVNGVSTSGSGIGLGSDSLLENSTGRSQSGNGIGLPDNRGNSTINNSIFYTNNGSAAGFTPTGGVDNTPFRFFNTLLWSNKTWTRVAIQEQFTNTTFRTIRGSITILPTVNETGLTGVNVTNLNITQNNAFLNSSTLAAFNTSAIITLNNITFGDPKPQVDFNDDGTFQDCAICSELSFDANVYRFNTTHFTTYQAAENASACGTLNTSTTLTGNVTSSGTCFVLNADNITLDCQGNTIFWDVNGTGADAITASNKNNITVKNCDLRDINASGSDGDGILFSTVQAGNITNNTIRTNGTSQSNPIQLMSGGNNSITDNTLIGFGTSSSNEGIFVSSSAQATIRGNTLSAFGTSSNEGILIQSSSHDATVRDNNVTANGSANDNRGIFISISDRVIIQNNTVRTDGTDSNHGIRANSDNNTIIQNTVRTSGSSSSNFGIYLSSTADTNNITSNTVYTHGTSFGVGIQISSGSDENHISSNILTTNGTAGSNMGIRVSAAHRNNITHNTIDTNADSGGSNTGIRIENSDNNTLTNNSARIETAATSFGISLQASQNNTFQETLINNSPKWIESDATSQNNLTNTTFYTMNGSIKNTEVAALQGAFEINKTNLNILYNSAFLNSSQITSFNTTARVTLFNIPQGAGAFPLVDLDDDGIFEPCQQPQCTPVSFTGGTFIFDVTGWTTYSSTIGGVNITLTKTDSADPVANGDLLNYTLLVNVTNGTAFNLSIQDSFPSEVAFVNASPTPDSGTNNTWTAGNLTIGRSFEVNVTVRVLQNATSGLINNTFRANFQNSTGSDIIVQTSETTFVNSTIPVVVVNKTDNPDPVIAGEELNYTIVVNLTSGNASNFTLTEQFPAQTQFVNASPAPDAGTNNTWSLGNLTIGIPVQVNITVLVFSNTTAGSVLQNNISVTYQNISSDTLSTNATANTTVTNLAPPVVNITKTDSPDPVTINNTLTYTITITNSGNGSAVNLTVNETYPNGTLFINATPAPDSGNDTFEIATLSGGASTQITINLLVNTTGTLNNTVNLTFSNITGGNFSIGTTAQTTANAQPTPTPGSPILGGGGGGGGGTSAGTSHTMSGESANQLMRRGDRLNFAYNNEQHSVFVNNIIGDSVTITIQSTPQRYTLQKNVPIQVDITGDKVADLIVMLQYVYQGQAMIHIEKLPVQTQSAFTQFPVTQDAPLPEPAAKPAEEPVEAAEPELAEADGHIEEVIPDQTVTTWKDPRIWLIGGWGLGLIIVLVYTLKNIGKLPRRKRR